MDYQLDPWQVALDVLFVVFLLVKLSLWILTPVPSDIKSPLSVIDSDNTPAQNPFPDWEDLTWDNKLMVFLLFLVFFTHFVGYISFLKES